MTPEAIADAWKWNDDPEAIRLPVKTLKINRCPAVAPISVLADETTEKRIGTSRALAQANLDKLRPHINEFTSKLLEAVKLMDNKRDQSRTAAVSSRPRSVDTELYDGGFIPDSDKIIAAEIIAKPE